MATAKWLLLIALLFFNIIQLSYTYWVPQNEKFWSLPISDLTTKPPKTGLNDVELHKILKGLSEKLRQEAIIGDRTIEYEGEEIPLKFNLDLESLSSSISNSESSEENDNLPLLLALETKLTKLVKENQRKQKELERKKKKPRATFRSIFDFQPDQGINDVFLKSVTPIQRTKEVEINLKNYSLFVTNTPQSIKYILIQTVPVENEDSDENYVDQSPYLEPDPPNFKDYTLRADAYDEREGGTEMKDKNALVEGYRSLYKLSSKHDTVESKTKSTRILDSILPNDVELKNRRGYTRPAKEPKTQPFSISMQDFNDAINKLKNNGKDKRIVLG